MGRKFDPQIDYDVSREWRRRIIVFVAFCFLIGSVVFVVASIKKTMIKTLQDHGKRHQSAGQNFKK